MKMQKVLLAVMLLPAMLFGAMEFYEVMPYKNHIATAPGYPPGISQTFINVVDELTEVHIWVGDMGDGETYDVLVRDLETNELIASATEVSPQQSWHWLPCTLIPEQGVKPVRGRTYRAVFTRAGGAPISYAYDPTNPYPHGELTAPGVPANSDLAMRVYGAMDTVERSLFGVNVSLFPLSDGLSSLISASWSSVVA